MTQPTIEGAKHGKPMMCFFSDGTDWYAALIDGSGHLQVDVVSSGLPSGAATETTLDAIKTAVEIIDGFADADNVLFGFNDRYVETSESLNPSAGTVQQDFTAVPAGEVWIIQAVTFLNNTTAQRTTFRVRTSGGSEIPFYENTPAAAGTYQCWNGEIVLKESDYIRFHLYNVVAGDDLYFRAWGYKMKV